MTLGESGMCEIEVAGFVRNDFSLCFWEEHHLKRDKENGVSS